MKTRILAYFMQWKCNPEMNTIRALFSKTKALFLDFQKREMTLRIIIIYEAVHEIYIFIFGQFFVQPFKTILEELRLGVYKFYTRIF